MRTALLLILALAVLALIGAILVQAPAGHQRRSAGVRRLDRGAPPEVRRLGPRSSIGSGSSPSSSRVWFKAILVGLTTSILACSVNRFRGLWKTAVRPRTRMAGTFYDHAPQSATLDAGRVGPSPTSETAAAVLRAHRFRTVVESDGDVVASLRRSLPVGAVRDPHRPPQPGAPHPSARWSARSFGYRDGEFAATVGTHRRGRRRDRAWRCSREASPTPTTRTGRRATTPATSSSTGTASRSPARPSA